MHKTCNYLREKANKKEYIDLHLPTVLLEANFDPFYFLFSEVDYNERNGV